MNGPIAQLVALTCHANSFLGLADVPSKFFPDNSTCTFCHRISFVEVKTSWLGKASERTVAEQPDAWFRYLASAKASGVRIIRRVQNDPRIADRMSAGFVGGGGQWMLGVSHPAATDYWMARWEVWNQNAPEKRIWRVTYGLVARDQAPTPADPDLSVVFAALESALTRIHAFSSKNNCGGFTECFARAIQSLKERSVAHGYYKDLYRPGSLSPSSEAMLDAAQSAWVFGGMGSWNDMGFDGEAGQEYEEASEQLFTAINDAICAAANESSKK
jgi:hypothetical protein